MTYSLQNAYTFAQIGLDNGLSQINSVTLLSGAQKVIVFFTDGWPNMVQERTELYHQSQVPLNFTMCDSGDVCLGLCPAVHFLSPSSLPPVATPRVVPVPVILVTPAAGSVLSGAQWDELCRPTEGTLQPTSMTAISNEAFTGAKPRPTDARESECDGLLHRTRQFNRRPRGG